MAIVLLAEYLTELSVHLVHCCGNSHEHGEQLSHVVPVRLTLHCTMVRWNPRWNKTAKPA